MRRTLPPSPDPRGYFEGCKTRPYPGGGVEIVYCGDCRQPVRVWFGTDRCGCQEPHSHLDEMLERVKQGR